MRNESEDVNEMRNYRVAKGKQGGRVVEGEREHWSRTNE
jgi:hypothetical protein